MSDTSKQILDWLDKIYMPDNKWETPKQIQVEVSNLHDKIHQDARETLTKGKID